MNSCSNVRNAILQRRIRILPGSAAWAVILAVSGLAAQSPSSLEGRWVPFRPPDGAFAVMFPAGPPSVTQNVLGGVRLATYFTQAGTTRFVLEVQESEHFLNDPASMSLGAIRPIGIQNVTVTDSSLRIGPYAGKWTRIEGTIGNPPHHISEIYRAVIAGPRRYVVRATSLPGQKLSVEADRFIESFALCSAPKSCEAGSASAGPGQPPSGSGNQVVAEDQTYFEFQVERPVRMVPSPFAPHYPDALRAAGVDGEVLVSFIVDTTGRAELGSFKVLKSSHELFDNAVRDALPEMRFVPAELGGRKVKQLVQQPFVFKRSA
jgi:TonB family protein